MSESPVFATGGLIGSSSDSAYIPARFKSCPIIPAALVRKYGAQFMESLKKPDANG